MKKRVYIAVVSAIAGVSAYALHQTDSTDSANQPTALHGDTGASSANLQTVMSSKLLTARTTKSAQPTTGTLDATQLGRVENAFTQAKPHQNGNSLHFAFDRDASAKVQNAAQVHDVIKQAAANYLHLRPEDDIVMVKSNQDNYGNEYHTFQQTYKDVPLHNTLLVTRVDTSQNLRLISGRFESNIEVNTTPTVEPKQATLSALQNLPQPPNTELSYLAAPSLQINFDDLTAQAALAYRSVVEYYDTSYQLHVEEVLVDAHNGKLLAQFNRSFSAYPDESPSRYDYINTRKQTAKAKATEKSASKSATVSTVAANNALQFPIYVAPLSPVVFGPVLPPPPPVIIAPRLPVPIFPPIVTAPQLPVPNFPPIVTAPLPAPNFPPIVTVPQLPAPNFPPIVTAPQLPVPNFPPIVTVPKLPVPTYPPIVSNPIPTVITPIPTSTPTTTTTQNTALTRALYQLPAGRNCVGDGNTPPSAILPGTFLFGESGPTATSPSMARGAYTNIGTTYWYYHYMHGRNAWDDNYGTLTASVNALFPGQTGCSPYNAQYMPAKGQIKDTSYISLADQMKYFPDKDQLIFGGDAANPFTDAPDLVAHEYTHGVTMHSSQIGSNPEGASMNEAYSDVFAAGVEAWSRSGGSKDGNPANGFSATIVNDVKTWELCEACGPNFPPRYLADPAKGKTSMHQSVYYYAQVKWPTTAGDMGNAHGNGGIFTMAFYLLTQGGVHPEAGTNGVPTVQVTGIGMEKALKAFYEANAHTLGPKSKYADARNLIADAATVIWEAENAGANSSCNSYFKSANLAFQAVGVSSTTYTCK